jgi:hypothetical protein
MRNPRTIARYVAALAVAVSLTPGTGEQSVIDYLITGEDIQCVEDMPCWDCSTMGNLRCGPVITPAGIETDTGENVAGYN